MPQAQLLANIAMRENKKPAKSRLLCSDVFAHFISLLHGRRAFDVANLPGTGTVDDAFFPGIGETVLRESAKTVQRFFHIGVAGVGGGNNEIKVFAADFFVTGYRAVNQGFHLSVHTVKIDRRCHDNDVGTYHLVENFGHVVFDDAFVGGVANAAAFAIGYVFILSLIHI